MMNNPKVSDLTVEELVTLIRTTVRESVAEMMLEFAIVAEMDAQVEEEAEFNAFMRATLSKIDLAGQGFLQVPQQDD